MSTTTPPPPPQLNALILDGYKCFADGQRLALKPLTLLYGLNNAGKSAALRALAIIARSVGSNAQGPWDMGTAADEPGRGASFMDLPWRGFTDRYDFNFALEWGAEPETRRLDQFLLSRSDKGVPYIRALRLNQPTRFERQDLIQQVRTTTTFSGLIPQRGQSDELDALAARLSTLTDQVQWLRGSRLGAPRRIRTDGATPTMLESDGRNAGLRLIHQWDPIHKDVQKFYSQLGRDLQPGLPFRASTGLFLDAQGQSGWKVELADVGEGMGTVLPVLVAIASAVHGCGPKIVLVEDPEAHLHDRAVRQLAEWIAEMLQKNSDVRIIMETHSETLKLAVQNLTRQVKLRPEDINLVWVEAQRDGRAELKEVPLNPEGLPTNSVLRDAFAEGRSLAAELAGLPPRRTET